VLRPGSFAPSVSSKANIPAVTMSRSDSFGFGDPRNAPAVPQQWIASVNSPAPPPDFSKACTALLASNRVPG
jgi:hypothetical protein